MGQRKEVEEMRVEMEKMAKLIQPENREKTNKFKSWYKRHLLIGLFLDILILQKSIIQK